VHFYEDDRDELYDLAQDIGETKNLATSHPDKAKALRTQLDAWLKSVDAQFPTANPNYDPTPAKAKAPAVKKAAK
jgi:arylsulfatase A-like enzyme